MANLLRTLRFLEKSLLENMPCMLLQVVESRGSSPGRGGFCMGVNGRGEMAGSIGGGIMEHKLVELARTSLKENSLQNRLMQQIHSKEGSGPQSGMICAGEQTVLLYPVNEAHIPVIQELLHAEVKHHPVHFSIRTEGIFIEDPFSKQPGWFPGAEGNWEFVGIAGKKPLLHIIGGGHCALALSRQMKWLDFRVKVYETRPDLNTLTENLHADAIEILPSYQQIRPFLENHSGDYVVVMTFGYRSDDEVIRALRDLSFEWLGLLGSKSKIARMMEEYQREGFEKEWLKGISAPVGIPIKSQTPEEIAVSIAAEIIAFRNRNL